MKIDERLYRESSPRARPLGEALRWRASLSSRRSRRGERDRSRSYSRVSSTRQVSEQILRRLVKCNATVRLTFVAAWLSFVVHGTHIGNDRWSASASVVCGFAAPKTLSREMVTARWSNRSGSDNGKRRQGMGGGDLLFYSRRSCGRNGEERAEAA